MTSSGARLSRWRLVAGASVFLLALAVVLVVTSLAEGLYTVAVQSALLGVLAVLLLRIGRAGQREGRVPATLTWPMLGVLVVALLWSALVRPG